MRAKLNRLCQAIDTAGDGMVNRAKLDAGLQDASMKLWLAGLGVEQGDLPSICDGKDVNLSYTDFVNKVMGLSAFRNLDQGSWTRCSLDDFEIVDTTERSRTCLMRKIQTVFNQLDVQGTGHSGRISSTKFDEFVAEDRNRSWLCGLCIDADAISQKVKEGDGATFQELFDFVLEIGGSKAIRVATMPDDQLVRSGEEYRANSVYFVVNCRHLQDRDSANSCIECTTVDGETIGFFPVESGTAPYGSWLAEKIMEARDGGLGRLCLVNDAGEAFWTHASHKPCL